MRIHKPLLSVLSAGTLAVVITTHGLLWILRNENILRPLKNRESALPHFDAFQRLPVYPEAELLNSEIIQMRFFNRYTATWRAKARPDRIAAWYGDRLTAVGWRQTIPPSKSNATKNLMFEKGWYDTLSLSIEPATDLMGTTHIILSTGPKYYPEDLLSGH